MKLEPKSDRKKIKFENFEEKFKFCKCIYIGSCLSEENAISELYEFRILNQKIKAKEIEKKNSRQDEILFDIFWFDFDSKTVPFEKNDFQFLNSKLRNEKGHYYLKSEVFKKDSYQSFFQKILKKKVNDPFIENIICQNIFLSNETHIMDIFSHIGLENIWFVQLWLLTKQKLLNSKNINIFFAKIINIGSDFLRFTTKKTAFLIFFEKNGFDLLIEILIQVLLIL